MFFAHFINFLLIIRWKNINPSSQLSTTFHYEQGSFLWIVNNIFFQYYSLLITVVCMLVFVFVSYASKAPDYARISGLTFSTMTEEDKRASRSTWSVSDVILSVLLVVIIIALYLYFTG